ncbi:Pre-mRNA-splicing factor [Wickerhamomyces ciferrii]|uniref:Pre-mRNA-splicing factor SLU7 n=1 Tax=Wickerhamomyces ciferrii (strain ATCC 14091 / BCRC 22168 / CBS 111 / JCM 3599 / NBRC 0793 / NRRL Y-1031 F-60-10) TaxID=1206466 RepID=K0KXM1_WICCF|nr:Pre-mRNA-splicing factor [Wickerhamomyces ciferrii]CCH46224.1 Pre-mRNA-splicing factor [Wickerhamomyces ciferrii]
MSNKKPTNPKENPYVPKYIKDVPWFQEQTNPNDYLSHHRNGNKEEEILNSEPKIGAGIKDEFISVQPEVQPKPKFKKLRGKKGCLNCGGIDHDQKNCLEKPGKSKINNKVEKPILNKRNEELDYDGQRDRWYGYDSKDYKKYLTNWEIKQKEKENEADNTKQYDTDEEIELKELGLDHDLEFINTEKQPGEKTIRIREDKAIYLQNYTNDNITYDPKSRMIRDQSTGFFNEQNLFVKHMTGDALKYEKTKTFAWDEEKKGVDASNYASNPTLADIKINETKNENRIKSEKVKSELMKKYDGSLSIKDQSDEEEESEPEPQYKDFTISKYIEDEYINNHTSVWGSYYKDGKWGYQCCKGMFKNSYCNK